MTITISVFAHSPDGGEGLARDMPVRWALEEVGLAYAIRPLSFADLKAPAHLARHPFGQIPTYEEDGLILFESGAIILHIAQRHAGLLPEDSNARARAIAWMFAALATVEPPIFDRDMAPFLEGDKSWHADRLPLLDDRVRQRLDRLADHLGDAPWLDGAFSAADLLMISALRRGADRLGDYPTLAAYVARGEARPAFRRAFADQLALFTAGP